MCATRYRRRRTVLPDFRRPRPASSDRGGYGRTLRARTRSADASYTPRLRASSPRARRPRSDVIDPNLGSLRSALALVRRPPVAVRHYNINNRVNRRRRPASSPRRRRRYETRAAWEVRTIITSSTRTITHRHTHTRSVLSGGTVAECTGVEFSKFIGVLWGGSETNRKAIRSIDTFPFWITISTVLPKIKIVGLKLQTSITYFILSTNSCSGCDYLLHFSIKKTRTFTTHLWRTFWVKNRLAHIILIELW